jgi:hypothetical protein
MNMLFFRLVVLVPKLCLGTPFAKLCFALACALTHPRGRRETEFREQRSQTEFGNEENRGTELAASACFFARLCFLCVLCDSVVSYSWAATPREELLRLVPDSVGFCLVVQDLRGHAAALEASPFLEQLRQSPFVVKMRNSDKWKKLGDLESEMKEKLGLDGKRLRDDIFGDAVVFAYRPGSPGQPQQEQGVMLLRARNEKVLADLIERINKVQKEEGELKELSERRHDGIVYYRRLEYDKHTQCEKQTYYYVHGPILAASERESMLRQIIDHDRRSASSTVSAAARRLRELDAEQALLAVWINPRAFDAEVDAKAANTPAERSAAVKHFALYWKALESVVLSLSPRERDIKLSLGVRARVAELPPAAQRLFREAAAASDLWRRFPQSALLAAGGRFDGTAFLDVTGGFLAPQGRKTLHDTLNRPFAALLGEEDFTGDLLPALGPDWGLCLSAPATRAGSSRTEQGNPAMPRILFALRVDANRTKKTLERTLLSALDFAARFVIFAHNNQHPDAPLALKTGAVNGQEVRYLTGERNLPAGVQPAYGLLDGYLVLASSLESMKRFAQESPGLVSTADAPVPLLRISFTDWRSYLTEHREAVVQFLIEHDSLSRDAAGRQVDGLLSALRFVERAELSQRSSSGQVIFSLTVQTAQALKK